MPRLIWRWICYFGGGLVNFGYVLALDLIKFGGGSYGLAVEGEIQCFYLALESLWDIRPSPERPGLESWWRNSCARENLFV
jgi:hypothetical protein